MCFGGGGDMKSVSPYPGFIRRDILKPWSGIVGENLKGGMPTFPGLEFIEPSGMTTDAFGGIGKLGGLLSQLFGGQNMSLPTIEAGLNPARTAVDELLSPFDREGATTAWEKSVYNPAMQAWKTRMLPMLAERGVGSKESGPALAAMSQGGSDLMTNLYGQLESSLYGGEQNRLGRLLPAAQASLGLMNAPFDILGQRAGLAQGLIDMLFKGGQYERDIGKERQGFEEQLWKMNDPAWSQYSNPYFQLGPTIMSSIQPNQMMYRPSGGGIMDAIAPALGGFLGSQGGTDLLKGMMGSFGGMGYGGMGPPAPGTGLLGMLGGAAGGIGNILGALPFFSDRQLKMDIVPITDALAKIQKLHGSTFKYKITPQLPSGGIMAQDLEEVLPDAVINTPQGKMVNYAAVIGLLVEAVKELSEKTKQE